MNSGQLGNRLTNIAEFSSAFSVYPLPRSLFNLFFFYCWIGGYLFVFTFALIRHWTKNLVISFHFSLLLLFEHWLDLITKCRTIPRIKIVSILLYTCYKFDFLSSLLVSLSCNLLDCSTRFSVIWCNRNNLVILILLFIDDRFKLVFLIYRYRL